MWRFIESSSVFDCFNLYVRTRHSELIKHYPTSSGSPQHGRKVRPCASVTAFLSGLAEGDKRRARFTDPH